MSDAPPSDVSASFVPPPERCVRLAELALGAGGSWSERAPAVRVAYEPPAWIAPDGGDVAEYFGALTEASLPAEGTAWLPEGRVRGDGVVLSADGKLLARDVSPDFGRGETEHWLVESGEKLRAPTALPHGPIAVVAAHLARGYCHWLLDEMPRLLALGPKAADVFFAHAGTEYARVAHARLGIADKILPAKRTTHAAGGPLVVPGYVGRPGFARAETLALLRDFTAGLGRGRATRGERIYITREGARRRRVAGERALRGMLDARGFTAVALEELEWEEQIAVFRAARIIVAPHGAGLANLVFAGRGTRVVELFARDYVNPCFWRVAALAGLDYRPVVAEGRRPPREEPEAGGVDIAVDIETVGKALSA